MVYTRWWGSSSLRSFRYSQLIGGSMKARSRILLLGMHATTNFVSS